MMKASLLLVAVAEGSDKCCTSCEAPLQRYYSVDTKHGHCGESCMNPNRFWEFKPFEPNLTIADGSTGYSSCADLGWPIYLETATHGFFPIKITVDLYNHADGEVSAESGSTCHLYEIKGDSCGQSDLDCKYAGQAKLFERSLSDGTCSEHGYTVKTGEQTIKVPFLGYITATTYSQGTDVSSTSTTCHLYAIDGETCGQSDLNCKYAGQAKLFERSLSDGTCAEHGYTVKTGEQTIKVPFLGDITATTYSQGTDVSATSTTCHLYAINGETCGQSDLNCKYAGQAKLFERSLSDGTCAEHGYTVKTGEQTIKVPFLGEITATTYSQTGVIAV